MQPQSQRKAPGPVALEVDKQTLGPELGSVLGSGWGARGGVQGAGGSEALELGQSTPFPPHRRKSKCVLGGERVRVIQKGFPGGEGEPGRGGTLKLGETGLGPSSDLQRPMGWGTHHPQGGCGCFTHSSTLLCPAPKPSSQVLRDAELDKALGADPRPAHRDPKVGGYPQPPVHEWVKRACLAPSLRLGLSRLWDGEAMAAFPGKGRELSAQILTGLLFWSKGMAGCFSALTSGMNEVGRQPGGLLGFP